MATSTLSIDVLKRSSIKISKDTRAVFPHKAMEREIPIEEITKIFSNKFYAIHRDTICFVSVRVLYVTPYTDIAVRSLEAAGFKREEFYVPFSNWDYPKQETLRWVELREKAVLRAIDDFIEDCKVYSDNNDIGHVKSATLVQCLQIPFSGLPVTDSKGQRCLYPILNIGEMQNKINQYIGRYNMKNNVVVFVYRDGRTYVTKGTGIIAELKRAGYTEKEMEVPLSNGETIEIETIQEQWQSIRVR